MIFALPTRPTHHSTNRQNDETLALQAQTLAALLPALLVEAKHIATTIAAGWHGRRRPGIGETFWQFRAYTPGEAAHLIDWRRSARDDHLYVRESEKEAAHTLWLWPDRSLSMHFCSHLSSISKRNRALLLTLALADLLANAGERIGVLDITQPLTSRTAAEHIANALLHAPDSDDTLPELHLVQRFNDVIYFTDLLDPMDILQDHFNHLVASGARTHIVQITDPIEESFPFHGRTEFTDPETGHAITAGRAEAWREAYQEQFAARRNTVRDFCRQMGWTFLTHHTDRPAIEPLLALYTQLAHNHHGKNAR